MLRTPAWITVWSALRVVMAAAIVAAVVGQLIQSISSAEAAGRDVATIVGNFFSFFTILSNVSAAIVLAAAAVWHWTRGRGADTEPAGLAVALACTTTYMIITGIVYNTLLRGYDLEPGAVLPWSNEVLHLVAPLFLLADLLIGPLRRALPWRAIWAIAAFPIVWVVYTMVRGPLITNPGTGDPFWYPYPFLNPHNDGGWISVIGYIIAIAVAIVLVAVLVVWWGRRVGVAPAAGGRTASPVSAVVASTDPVTEHG